MSPTPALFRRPRLQYTINCPTEIVNLCFIHRQWRHTNDEKPRHITFQPQTLEHLRCNKNHLPNSFSADGALDDKNFGASGTYPTNTITHLLRLSLLCNVQNKKTKKKKRNRGSDAPMGLQPSLLSQQVRPPLFFSGPVLKRPFRKRDGKNNQLPGGHGQAKSTVRVEGQLR